jgi:SAM-dependent methyltransferase
MNSYNEAIFREKSGLYWEEKIHTTFGNHVECIFSRANKYHNDMNITPRQYALSSVFFVSSLYYLEFLLKKNPKVIVDIGCGANLFKKLIPNIYGIDPMLNNHLADEFDFFDANFSQEHTDVYESVFSINALHFISLIDFERRILEFYNIVAPGGRGFITFNVMRMLELTDLSDRQLLFSSNLPTPDQLTQYVNAILNNLSIKFLLAEVLINDTIDEPFNGNIRLIFDK